MAYFLFFAIIELAAFMTAIAADARRFERIAILSFSPHLRQRYAIFESRCFSSPRQRHYAASRCRILLRRADEPLIDFLLHTTVRRHAAIDLLRAASQPLIPASFHHYADEPRRRQRRQSSR
jgi:hypothetical protein